MNPKVSVFREYAGVLTAQIVVVGFVLIGFLQMAAKFMYGVDIDASEAWSSAMLSLASAALGFLIGKQTTATTMTGVSDTITVPIAPAPVTVGTSQTTTVVSAADPDMR